MFIVIHDDLMVKIYIITSCYTVETPCYTV
jgi:hypothetical protein